MAKPLRSLLAENVLGRLEELKLSARKASEMTGRGPDVIRNLLRASNDGRPYNPRSDTLLAVSEVLKTTPDWLLSHNGDLVAVAEAKRSPDIKPLPKREDRERLVKVYASAEGGDGSMVLYNEPVEYAPRPNIIPDEDDLYGVVIEGSSMGKLFRAGDTAWVHPRYRERRDEPCVFRRYNDMTGEISMTVKWLNNFNTKVWKVEQFDPPKEFELSRQDWPDCFRILGKKNRA